MAGTSFTLICLAVFFYGFLHSWLASLEVKALVADRLGAGAARGYRLFYNLVATLTLLPVLALPALLPDHLLYELPFPWGLFAFGGQGLAVLALLAGVLQTGPMSFVGLQQVLNLPTPERPQLVQTGLYRWVRHPLYTAGFVFMWLSPRMTLNLLALYLGVSIYLVAGAYLEERKLLQEFGELYRLYRQRTPMFVPGLKCHKIK